LSSFWKPLIHPFEGRRQQAFSKNIVVSPSWDYNSPFFNIDAHSTVNLSVYSSACCHTQCNMLEAEIIPQSPFKLLSHIPLMMPKKKGCSWTSLNVRTFNHYAVQKLKWSPLFDICLLKFFANWSTCHVIFWLKKSHSTKPMIEL
jgi:hypothetical protein